MEHLVHFDPITLAVVVIGFIANQYISNLLNKKDSASHGKWIEAHQKECVEQRKQTNEILTELRTTNAHLATLVDGHQYRIARIENQMDTMKVGR